MNSNANSSGQIPHIGCVLIVAGAQLLTLALALKDDEANYANREFVDTKKRAMCLKYFLPYASVTVSPHCLI